MWYVDTSVIVAAVSHEIRTERSVRFLRACGPGDWTTGELALPEIASALSLKVRTGTLRASDRERTDLAVAGILAAGGELAALAGSDFHQAATLCRDHRLGLRTLDALHLALAMRLRLALVTLDARLAQAAGVVRHPVEPLEA
jgi:uncharacterized protein